VFTLNFNSHILTHFLYSAHARVKSLHACFSLIFAQPGHWLGLVTGLGWAGSSPAHVGWAGPSPKQ
jgi:hypothetical protein